MFDFWDVQPSGGDVGGDKTLDTPVSEGLEGDFSLFLWDIAMKNLTFDFEVCVEEDFVGLV